MVVFKRPYVYGRKQICTVNQEDIGYMRAVYFRVTGINKIHSLCNYDAVQYKTKPAGCKLQSFTPCSAESQTYSVQQKNCSIKKQLYMINHVKG